MLERMMEKEAFLSTAWNAAKVLSRSGWKALQGGARYGRAAAATGNGFGNTVASTAGAAGRGMARGFEQGGGMQMVRNNPGKFLAAGGLGAGGLGYMAAPSYTPYSEYDGPRVRRNDMYVKTGAEINLGRLMDSSNVTTLKTAGLHKIAAAMEKVASGRDVGPEMTLPIAVQLLGEKAFQKRAEHRQIGNGLKALRALQEG